MIQSNPIHSIQSDSIQSNPIRSNPIQIKSVYCSVDEMLSSMKDEIDAVYLATPTHTHLPLSTKVRLIVSFHSLLFLGICFVSHFSNPIQSISFQFYSNPFHSIPIHSNPIQYNAQIAAAHKPCLVEVPLARSSTESEAIISAFSRCHTPLFVSAYARALHKFAATRQLLFAKHAIGQVQSNPIRYNSIRFDSIQIQYNTIQ